MAGTIFGMPLSQQINAVGRPLSGGLLYTYQSNTSTPVDTFSDFALSSVNTWPLELDSAGRVPVFWLDDGTYRVRLTTSGGVTIFDNQAITALGPSSGDSGGSAAVDTETVFGTGDTLWVPVDTTRSGWVRLNGRTISSGAGSGTERANADTEALFAFLWNNFSDSICAVSGGRGASAVADYGANKTIATFSMRGKTGFGLDTMGNSAASVIAGGTTPGTNGTTAGAATVTLSQANLPSAATFTISGTAATHTHATGTYAVGSEAAHTHASGSFAVATTITNGTVVVRSSQTENNVRNDGGGLSDVPINTNDATLSLANGDVTGTSAAGSSHTHTLSGASAASGTLALTGTAASGGSDTAVNNLPPYVVGTWYIKL